jgi:cell volume regulation protein A
MSHLDLAKADLLSVAILLIAGLVGSWVAKKIRVPDIVLFLVMGIGLGPAVSGVLVVGQDTTMNQLILTIGACYLLFEGGTTLQLSVLRQVWITLLVIATVGVLITGAITTTAAVWLGIPFLTALVLGAVTASTDPATLVPIFRQIPIRARVAQTVMSESAFNDAMAAIATFAIVGVVLGSGGSGAAGQVDWTRSLLDFGWEAGVGIGVGLGLGFLASFSIAHRLLGVFRGSEPFVLVLSIILAYLSADALHASGFMAVFVLGVVLGNREHVGLASHDHHQEQWEHDAETLSLLMRMSIFLLLGSQVSFPLLGAYWWQGLVLLVVFLFVARPATVFLCAGPDRRARWTVQELLFMSWTRETGVIPAALVGMLVGMKVPGMEAVGSITFVFILGTILIQAPTTAWVARKLGLLEPAPGKPVTPGPGVRSR